MGFKIGKISQIKFFFFRVFFIFHVFIWGLWGKFLYNEQVCSLISIFCQFTVIDCHLFCFQPAIYLRHTTARVKEGNSEKENSRRQNIYLGRFQKPIMRVFPDEMSTVDVRKVNTEKLVKFCLLMRCSNGEFHRILILINFDEAFSF